MAGAGDPAIEVMEETAKEKKVVISWSLRGPFPISKVVHMGL